MTPEGLTKKAIRKILDGYKPSLYYFMPVQAGYGKRTVDFLVCYEGNFLAIEAKRRGAKPRKIQLAILDEIRKAGGLTFVIDDEPDSLYALRAYLESKPHDGRPTADTD
jgi:hypothetical protein